MLLVLLLGVVDFGRVFAAGITLEAATRNAAEAAAQEYVQVIRNNGSGTLSSSDYRHLHQVALATLCHEGTVLPNFSGSGTTCSMPLAAVCVHNAPDASFLPDPACDGSDAPAPPTGCGTLSDSWSPNNAQGSGALAYVEVRACYQFTTLFNLRNLELPFGWSLTLGDIYLQRTRDFTVACYYAGCS